MQMSSKLGARHRDTGPGRSAAEPALTSGAGADCVEDPEELFRTMAEHHGVSMYQWLLRRGRAPQDAWDLVQDAFERALSRRPNVGSHADLRAWLMVVLRNRLIDIQRSSHSRARRLEDFEKVPAPPTEVLARWRMVDSDQVKAMLHHLSPAFRSVVSMRMEGRAAKEIADSLAVPLSTVNVRLFRARRKLRSLLLADGMVS